VCGLKHQHAVKPRYKAPCFLEEYKAEIALVAFDQLLYHLEEKHAEETSNSQVQISNSKSEDPNARPGAGL
jgi:hypothetical protein